MAPPSLHPSGRRYTWRSSNRTDELPIFDRTWIETNAQIVSTSRLPVSGKIRSAVAYIRRIQAIAGECGHNATFRAACKLRDAGLSSDEALAILDCWNRTNAEPPWSAAELQHKIESAYQRCSR